MVKPKKASAAKTEPDEIGWTVRMPRELSELIKERAAALTGQGGGKWTGNMVIVATLKEAAKAWST